MMSSLTSSKIPVIDFSIQDLESGTDSWRSVSTEVHKALESYGCFEVLLREVELQQAMLKAMTQLFDLPLETRLKQPPNDRHNGRGDPLAPLHETVGLSDVEDPDIISNFANLMWPQGNSNFCDVVCSYVKQASQVEKMVTRMVLESLGVETYYDSLADSTSFVLRLNRYRIPKKDETNVGLNVHTDSGFLSILRQNEVNGLEIQAKDGQWISVKPSTSSSIVLVGDAMMAWSNGRLHAPPHRVFINEDSMRYSIAMFAFIKGMMIETPKELIDDEHPQMFKPFDHFLYRRFLTSGEGLKAKSPIRAYCGI